MKFSRRLLTNSLLVLTAIVIGLFFVEVMLRWLRPISIATIESGLQAGREPGVEYLVPDESLGLRPNLGTSVFDENGIGIPNSIHSSAENSYKILFLGDSVTQRAEIVRALAARLSSENTSYLNGGVSGYNIREEVEFFLRFQHAVNPDAIFHTIHVNDLRSTKLLNRNINGVLTIHSRNANPQNVNPWLYQHSQLYRFLIMRFLLKSDQADLRTEAVEALRQLQKYMRLKNIAYYPVLFPILQPREDWSSLDTLSHKYLMEMSDELGLGIVDLQEVAERLFEKGVNPQQSPGDTWHPNRLFADEATKYILDRMPSIATRGQNPD
ncbi:MAG: hypothetical protein K8F25_11570 [Fimbriimonadaceae bacterium]|nr:hypothetical protein [Alphaproteobacteria bacterium]